ncbi:cystine/glutamate transporter isoform X2 [Denticeps clupeoides]|uniref:cystine/glutamate transporter isoform X2 n=1 Tax=Denticeps clupeoides TaxID=299321 RepID=UPI0010A47F56|nr:cystine/glutamate transporter-like isoform X2 [Denticeps clupeoides]
MEGIDAEPAGHGQKASPGKTEAVHLKRSIGLLSATSFIIGTVVGSGIFIAPKGVLKNSGSVGLSLVVWTLCGVLSLFGALCYAELGTTFKKSGGHYMYLLETLGPLPAFLRIWAEFIFIRPAVASYVSLAFGRYVVEPFFTPCSAPDALVKLVSILGVTFVVAVNSWSVTLASRTQVALTFVKMFALVLIIGPGIMALAQGRTENFQGAFISDSATLTNLPLAFYSGLYAFGGWFYLNFVTEEVINPTRNIPLAIIISMVLVTIFYVLVNVAYYAIMSADELLMSEAVAVVNLRRPCHPKPGFGGAHLGLSVLPWGPERGLLRNVQDDVRWGQGEPLANSVLHDSHPQADPHACRAPAVPPVCDHDRTGRDLPADQLLLVLALVLHRPGHAGPAGSPLQISPASQAIQGSSGCGRHLHAGVHVHRGPVSVLGPLEHRQKLRPHADRRARLLPDRAPPAAARPLPAGLRIL